ncbi:MAG: OsmC family protein [Lentisphaeria bacterium]
MPKRQANAKWMGNLQKGNGSMEVESGAFKGQYSFASRFESGSGTNPEELIAAAHAGCFSMALSHVLDGAGFAPQSVATEATVSLDKVGEDFTITKIILETEAQVPDISDEDFQKYAEEAKNNCPVSKALAGPEIKLNAKLIS